MSNSKSTDKEFRFRCANKTIIVTTPTSYSYVSQGIVDRTGQEPQDPQEENLNSIGSSASESQIRLNSITSVNLSYTASREVITDQQSGMAEAMKSQYEKGFFGSSRRTPQRLDTSLIKQVVSARENQATTLPFSTWENPQNVDQAEGFRSTSPVSSEAELGMEPTHLNSIDEEILHVRQAPISSSQMKGFQKNLMVNSYPSSTYSRGSTPTHEQKALERNRYNGLGHAPQALAASLLTDQTGRGPLPISTAQATISTTSLSQSSGSAFRCPPKPSRRDPVSRSSTPSSLKYEHVQESKPVVLSSSKKPRAERVSSSMSRPTMTARSSHHGSTMVSHGAQREVETAPSSSYDFKRSQSSASTVTFYNEEESMMEDNENGRSMPMNLSRSNSRMSNRDSPTGERNEAEQSEQLGEPKTASLTSRAHDIWLQFKKEHKRREMQASSKAQRSISVDCQDRQRSSVLRPASSAAQLPSIKQEPNLQTLAVEPETHEKRASFKPSLRRTKAGPTPTTELLTGAANKLQMVAPQHDDNSRMTPINVNETRNLKTPGTSFSSIWTNPEASLFKPETRPPSTNKHATVPRNESQGQRQPSKNNTANAKDSTNQNQNTTKVTYGLLKTLSITGYSNQLVERLEQNYSRHRDNVVDPRGQVITPYSFLESLSFQMYEGLHEETLFFRDSVHDFQYRTEMYFAGYCGVGHSIEQGFSRQLASAHVLERIRNHFPCLEETAYALLPGTRYFGIIDKFEALCKEYDLGEPVYKIGPSWKGRSGGPPHHCSASVLNKETLVETDYPKYGKLLAVKNLYMDLVNDQPDIQLEDYFGVGHECPKLKEIHPFFRRFHAVGDIKSEWLRKYGLNDSDVWLHDSSNSSPYLFHPSAQGPGDRFSEFQKDMEEALIWLQEKNKWNNGYETPRQELPKGVTLLVSMEVEREGEDDSDSDDGLHIAD